jgi:hypothetical protein
MKRSSRWKQNLMKSMEMFRMESVKMIRIEYLLLAEENLMEEQQQKAIQNQKKMPSKVHPSRTLFS